ncbi:hypothetical protein LCGC14_0427200 [marine sediment metagenome]|uniref:Uncharacterized protein n=1 Tax=marine sediment metagenome TaxID=412755 RepID=A0A0F9VYN8_9ZZZZ
MGGTVKGRVDCVVGDAPDGNRNLFVNCKQFFDGLVTAGYGAIHASNFGASASGFDFHDGTSPAGENAWFVFEWAISTERPGGGSVLGKVYTLVQWADGTAFGTAPGNPGLLKGAVADGVGFQTAFREDGGDPWNGTSAADGADTKGATVWTAGASSLHILDYSSTPTAGTHDTNFENMLSPGVDAATIGSANRVHFLADEDSFIFLFDKDNNGEYSIYFAGLYIPKPDVTASYPMICISHTALPLSTTFSYGTAGGNSIREGGLVTADTLGPIVGSWRPVSFDSQMTNTTLQPNPQSLAVYDEFDIVPYNFDASKAVYGWPGSLDLIRQVYNAPTHMANSDLTRAIFGDETVSSVKISTPWGGDYPPGTGTVRTGRSF